MIRLFFGDQNIYVCVLVNFPWDLADLAFPHICTPEVLFAVSKVTLQMDVMKRPDGC